MLSVALATLLLQASSPLELRTVTVVATDAKGAPVRGLGAADAVVVENGVAREVVELALDERPLTLALLVDNSAPMATPFRLTVLDAVVQFLNRLPEGARCAVWTTGDRPSKVADFGADPGQVASALKRSFPSGGNTLLDALVEVSDEMRKREGERLVVVAVTGSGIGFSNWDRFQVVERAKASRAQFLAVQFEETGPPDLRGDGTDQVGRLDYDFVLGWLTRETGGRLERSLSAQGVGRALDALAADLSAQYRLSYRSLPGSKGNQLSIEVTRPDVKLRVGRVKP
ncbi:MAG TPA: VWA domain-containing protein [Vicinamibacteria bacterium]|nr:VWA domain-containing protein [Vicinamibacteria bacterium]